MNYAGNENIMLDIISENNESSEPIKFEFKAGRSQSADILNNWDWLDDTTK